MNTRVILLLILIISSNCATAKNEKNQMVWFSSDTSILLNRSSIALAEKRIDRGMRLARHALTKELSLADELIAHYNLCMAVLISGRSDTKDPFCKQALELAQTPMFVTRENGTLRLQRTKNNQNRNSLTIDAYLRLRIKQLTEDIF